MDTQLIFWILMLVTAIELFAIYALGFAINSVLKSDVFKKKMEAVRKRDVDSSDKSSGSGVLSSAIAIGAFLLPSLAFGADEVGSAMSLDVSWDTIYVIVGLDVILLGILWYMRQLLNSMVNIDADPVAVAAQKEKAKSIDVMRILTDAVPIEEEESVATDHEYDGIRELDNNLPPWWKWGFYLTIVVSVIYLVHYHVLKTGDLQVEAYHKNMEQAKLEVQAYLEAQALNVDENSVVIMEAADDLRRGQNIYMEFCKVCHGGQGEGLVGPNLTDAYWIYGGKINDVFKTIKYGAKNGMKSWTDELNPVQIQQVSSFIMSLQGSQPDNPKPPQGEYFEVQEEIEQTVDSTTTIESASLNE